MLFSSALHSYKNCIKPTKTSDIKKHKICRENAFWNKNVSSVFKRLYWGTAPNHIGQQIPCSRGAAAAKDSSPCVAL